MKVLKSILYYLVSYTWGVIMTLIGSLVALFLLITGHKPHHFYQNIYFRIGRNWGGINFGPFFIIDNTEGLSTKQHESGHGIQNICLGPLMPFIIGIPSLIRYYLIDRSTITSKKKFSACILGIFILIGIMILCLGILLNNIALCIISDAILIYGLIIFIWLMCKEIPQYENGAPDYLDIWFEGNASNLGEKYYPENDGEVEDQK